MIDCHKTCDCAVVPTIALLNVMEMGLALVIADCENDQHNVECKIVDVVDRSLLHHVGYACAQCCVCLPVLVSQTRLGLGLTLWTGLA